ncbi:MAG: DEAD/DEAH box helicase family protein, partial [Mycoplasmataceae bacterium]|nr:DEAD/DEAH box helicase family protein [Mycoplasmataceae bacterium]
MIVLKECQQEAVNKLFEKYRDFHYDISNKEIYFQAPTGAGKTLILCTLCDKIVQYSKKCIILFVSISTGDIQVQNYDKSCLYQSKNYYKYRSYLIKSQIKNIANSKLDTIIQIPLKNHQVYFMGSSSYKDKAKLCDENILQSFLDDAKKGGYEIIYIRDEAHIGTKKDNNTKNLDQLLNKYANLTYYVSATLEQEHKIHVKIKMEEAINDGLVKSNLILYAGIDEDNITSKQLYEQAIKEFKEVKKKYQALNYGINPCMLIQIKNTKKEDKEKEQALIKELTTTINEHQLKYLVYTEDNKKESNTRFFNNKSNLSAKEKAIITANDSIIDVIIFKVSLATGWDIPRANMLLQLREIYSDTLDVQTIGRIRRNPLARTLNENERILDNYYIYSNVPKKKNNKCRTWKHNDEVILTKDFSTIILQENDLNNSKEKEPEIDDIYEGLITWFKRHNKFT